MGDYRRGSLWSNTLVFLGLIFVLIALASVTKARANPSNTSAGRSTTGQANNVSRSIPVTGRTIGSNLSPPHSANTAQVISQPAGGVYTVQAGDTLASIALRFNTSADALLRANPQISISDPLTAGETLFLPGSTVVIDGQTIYFARSGDDLFAIAAHHGITLADLEQANPQIQPPALIFPGEGVAIP